MEALFERFQTTIARDLKLNLERLLTEGALDKTDAHLALLATAASVGIPPLVDYAQNQLAADSGLGQEEIIEAREAAAIMGMLNTYYRFKHMVDKEDDYRSAGLRMTSLAKPKLGKKRFEMLSFGVSVLNGCETCIRAHENVLRDSEVPVEQIHDLARIAAVVKGLKPLMVS